MWLFRLDLGHPLISLFLLPESLSWASGRVRYTLLFFLAGTVSVKLFAFSESLEKNNNRINILIITYLKGRVYNKSQNAIVDESFD